MGDAAIGVVWNPAKCERAALAAPAARVLAADVPLARVHWFETTADDPGRGAASRALDTGCDLVVAAGGDGTVTSVAAALAGTDAHLGIVPQGTGNLLARNLEIPLDDVEAAFRRAITGQPRQIDMGWVDVDRDGATESHGFLVMAGFGIDAQMLVETDHGLKERIGWIAYAEAMARAITASDLVGLDVAIDGARIGHAEAHTMLVGNCGTVAGSLRLLPDARPDDGSLDVLMVSATGLGQWAGALKKIAWDNGVNRRLTAKAATESTDAAVYFQARTVRVRLDSPQRFEIDGEEIGEISTVTIRLDEAALTVR